MSKLLSKIYKGKKGITGLETAIILIAFVTVAAVLAYTVLSAGIFSSERGKEAVYSGLQSAQSTMAVKGSVLIVGQENVVFDLAMVVSGGSVDLTKLVVKYWDSNVATPTTLVVDTDVTFVDAADGVTAVTQVSGNNTVTVKATPTGLGALKPYQTFTIEIIPPTGASLTIQRTIPATVDVTVAGDDTPDVINLN